MRIIPQKLEPAAKEFDALVAKYRAERAHQWRKRSGIAKLWARIRLEVWAWRRGSADWKVKEKEDSYKLY
jgi:hypothetical protein